MSGGTTWITLGKTQFSVDYLVSVDEDEAVSLLTTPSVHEDRVRNAWKQANKLKNPNRKRQESVTVAVIEPKDSEKVIEPKKKRKR